MTTVLFACVHRRDGRVREIRDDIQRRVEALLLREGMPR